MASNDKIGSITGRWSETSTAALKPGPLPPVPAGQEQEEVTWDTETGSKGLAHAGGTEAEKAKAMLLRVVSRGKSSMQNTAWLPGSLSKLIIQLDGQPEDLR